MIYELYGLREDLDYGYGSDPISVYEVRNLIATFDSEELAKEYVKKSELKNPQHLYGLRMRYGKYRYRASSLLRGYADCEIVIREEPIEPQHNPIL